MHKQPLGLNRRGFIRLLAITVAVVLVFYAIGLYLNHMGLQTLHGNMEALNERECSYIASQINLEVGNLITQCQELAADKELLRYVIAYPRLSAYQRIASISGLSDKLLRMKRSCDLLENAKILLPQIDRVISTENPSMIRWIGANTRLSGNWWTESCCASQSMGTICTCFAAL